MINWNDHPTVRFAESELKRYWKRLDSETHCGIQICPMPPEVEKRLAEGQNTERCDMFTADIRGGEGVLYANSPRSALLGVYQLLRQAGCRFIRPGVDGEYIPRRPMESFRWKKQLCSRCFHRGITIEGAVSLENVLEMIDWAPKVGYNAYFIQFKDGYQFFDRWYSHEGNPVRSPENYTREQCRKDHETILGEIKKRSMILHAVGHGWTCAALGMDTGGWYEESADTLSADKKNMLAMIGGKRDFFKKKPLNTQLCYSSSLARKSMVQEIVSYAQEHPEVDYLHIWLADDFNNFCECSECRKKMPADLYIQLLNELDDSLTANGLKTRIVFLIYYELFWPPRTERIRNPERFTMMFAPMFRTYTQPYREAAVPDKPIEYQRNLIKYPKDTGVYLRFLKEWQKVFNGDCFSFEYYLMWDQYRDIGQMTLAKIIYEDILALKDLGINGVVSCQLNRCAFPTAFPNYMMGLAQLDCECSFDALRTEYFSAAFGSNMQKAEEYLDTIGKLYSFAYNTALCEQDDQLVQNLKKIPEFADRLLAVYPMESEPVSVKKSWFVLHIHAWLYQEISKLMEKLLDKEHCDFNQIYSRWTQLASEFWALEPSLQSEVDMFYLDFITKEYLFRGYSDELEQAESKNQKCI